MRRERPSLTAFEEDMNKHRNAEYRQVDERYILEFERDHRGKSATLTVWEAIMQGGEYVRPDDATDNSFHWDGIGRTEFNDIDAGSKKFKSLSGKGDVRQFCQVNPYDGPRTPYSEQDN